MMIKTDIFQDKKGKRDRISSMFFSPKTI